MNQLGLYLKSKRQYKDGDWIDMDSIGVGFSYPAQIHEEPKTVEVDVWLNVYAECISKDWVDNPETNDDYGYYYRDERDADLHKQPGRIACINIKRTVTEGEGL